MQVVGYSRAPFRGRFGLLAAAVVCALPSLCLPGASAAASSRAKGIDVSNWNGTIKWSKVAAAGYRFVFAKATEGTTFNDSTYVTNRNGSEGAGLVFGAYHFARPSGGGQAAATASAIAQADHFLAVASPQPHELPPVLDLESTGKLKPARLQIWASAWLGEIYARLGVDPFVYTSPSFWSSYLGDTPSVAASGVRLWIAHWTSASQPWVPAQNWNGQGWTFWQWTDCLSVPGIARCTDGDRMNGSNPSSAAIQPYPTGVPVLSTPPSIVGAPQAGKKLAAVPGLWEGGKPLQFVYQWQRCDAAGANCAAIDGATGEKYTPADADVGHSLDFVVTATSAQGSASAAAPPTAAVSPAGTPSSAQPTNIAAPQILGTEQVGQVQTSSVGTWTGSPTKFTYRWRRCDANAASCIAIRHATQARYTLTPDDIGSTLSLVVTATGAGGAATAGAPATGVVVAAPLPPVSIGSQTVERGVAGNVQTEDGRATVTWQPGSVRVGLTVSLDAFTSKLTLPGSEVALTVPDLPAKGFAWPLDVAYAQPKPKRAVLGYSTDGRVYSPIPQLETGALPKGTAVGTYVDSNGLTHVLTRTPLRLALFKRRAWGDPTYTSPKGPSLVRQAQVRILFRGASRSVLVLTRLAAQSQTKLTATVFRSSGGRISVIGKGSRLGVRLRPGRTYHAAKVQLYKPRMIPVRLRLNGRLMPPGKYRVHIVAFDPWGRHSGITLRFRYR
jgi:GH25 family lysozyme M1 (1,4-beta-N-acetylmuramidase)